MMSKDRLLNYLESVKKQDDIEIKSYRDKIISEIKSQDKKNLIKVPKKITLWERIKIVLGF